MIESNGKISTLLPIAFGATSSGGIARFNSDWSVDTSLGFIGIFRGTNIGRNGLSIQPDGKILTVGGSTLLIITRHINNIQPTASSNFDGDGFSDTAIYRPSVGQWFILRSSDNSSAAFQFGSDSDVPIDGDFDGDGRNDLAIYRQSSGVWFFQRSSDNTTLGATFGTSTDKPIPGDYDKDGKTDIAVFILLFSDQAQANG